MTSPAKVSVSRVRSFAFNGIEPVPVTVEVLLSSGVPSFLLVGMADKAIGEARERVRAAFSAIGLALPPKRILVNLSPADFPKEGAHFDLPIALALLGAMGVVSPEETEGWAAIGEISLDGRIKPVNGVLCAAYGAAIENLGLVCPAQQASEAQWGHPDLMIAPAPSLSALIAHFQRTVVLSPPSQPLSQKREYGPDMEDIKGMSTGRRVLEIAAAGRHSVLLNGPPGAGKSMLSARLPGLLPDLTPEEILETSRVYSMAGLLPPGQLVVTPPYRAPHHSASMSAMVGGGVKVRPGEISLAHFGVLFLDELPEFSRPCLEALRQPLENGTVSIARANQHVTFPAHFQFIAAMNPCKCGYLGDEKRECRKSAPLRGRLPKPYLRPPSGPHRHAGGYSSPVSA